MANYPELREETAVGGTAVPEKPSDKDEVCGLREEFGRVLREIVVMDAGEKSKVECIEEAVCDVLSSVPAETLEDNPELLSVLVAIGRAARLAEQKVFHDFNPELGTEKLNDEYRSFVNSFTNPAIKRFLMAFGHYRMGQWLTYKEIDAGQRKTGKRFTPAFIEWFRQKDFLPHTSPFYISMKKGRKDPGKGREKNLLRLCRRRRRG